MLIGVPREIKVHEDRVGQLPARVPELTRAGHEVLVDISIDQGWREACMQDPRLLDGLNVHGGRITHQAVQSATGLEYLPAIEALVA